jgi:hypothetical protein
MNGTARRRFDQSTDHPVAIDLCGGTVDVTLADGRGITAPLVRHPWLMNGTPDQRANFEMGYVSVWWPDLDEGLDIEWMLREADLIQE